MKVLVIGNGGREHALVWKLSQSPKISQLYMMPGNPGCFDLAINVNLDINNNQDILNFCLEHNIDLVVIGPEIPLVKGLADLLEEHKIKVFGPGKKAAQIESSKVFAKNLMAKYNIPTAKYATFNEAAEAVKYLESAAFPIVIKASGLAAGKGVIIAQDLIEAQKAVTTIMTEEKFGSAGGEIVIEEFMEGEEMSLLCFTDGDHIIPMLPAQDHKRIYDNDLGPNTGGMGAYAPAPLMTPQLLNKIQREILEPVLHGLKQENCKFKGCLYAGLMIDKNNQPKVVEFNARFGDPETQVIMPLLKSDLLEIMLACIDGTLENINIEWHNGGALCVVMAAEGYPEAYEKGNEIIINSQRINPNTIVFHAGTKLLDDKLLTNGGRVLNVVNKAEDLPKAFQQVYKDLDHVKFKNAHYRKDIGRRGLKRLGYSGS